MNVEGGRAIRAYRSTYISSVDGEVALYTMDASQMDGSSGNRVRVNATKWEQNSLASADISVDTAGHRSSVLGRTEKSLIEFLFSFTNTIANKSNGLIHPLRSSDVCNKTVL